MGAPQPKTTDRQTVLVCGEATEPGRSSHIRVWGLGGTHLYQKRPPGPDWKLPGERILRLHTDGCKPLFVNY